MWRLLDLPTQQIAMFKGIWEVHWFMLAHDPRACSPSQITCANKWGIIYSEEFIQTRGAQQQLDCLVQKAKSDTNDLLVSQITMGQWDDPAWHLARRGHLTANNFGSLLHAKRVTPSLLKRLLELYDVPRVKEVQWGVNNEAKAVKAFINLTGKTVQKTGIWLDGSGILGAFPGRIVDEDCFGGQVSLHRKEHDNRRGSECLPQFLLKENWKWPIWFKGRTCLLASGARGDAFFSQEVLLICCVDI